MIDLDTMVVLLLGVARSKRICRILERLSKLDSSIIRDKYLKANINRLLWLILLYLGIKICSFLHSTNFRTTFKSNLFAINCSSLGNFLCVQVLILCYVENKSCRIYLCCLGQRVHCIFSNNRNCYSIYVGSIGGRKIWVSGWLHHHHDWEYRGYSERIVWSYMYHDINYKSRKPNEKREQIEKGK